MAYPASTQNLQDWMAAIDQKAIVVKNEANNQSAASSAGTLNMDMVRRFYDLLKAVNVFYTSAASVTGLANFIITQKQNATADPLGDFTTMQNAIKGTIDWLNTNVPSGTFNSTTYKLGWVFPVDYTTPVSTLTFTALQTAGYRTVLTTLIATIG